MASISNDPNGRRRILFTGADGKRHPIRLGKVSLRYAESVKVKVENLVSASITGHAPADETSRWLAALNGELFDKLVRSGLAKRRETATLGGFTRSYIDGRVDIKPRTRINLEQVRRYLLDCFDAMRQMRDITAGDADDFRLHLIRQGKSENTVRRAIGRARQFFRAAMKHGLLMSNAFDGIPASVRANPERFYYVSQDEARKVLDACPDAEWRLIFCLARYGGLRCPSEVLAVTWTDVNWDQSRIRVPSSKTEHHEGGESRMIPIFPELLPHLRSVFEQAEPGTRYVITRFRDSNTNLRTQFQRIIRRAGLQPWPKLFQNLRSTRETELAETFPMHVVCKWIGNSQPVAAQHYLQVTDEHFKRAVKGLPMGDGEQAAQNAAQKSAEDNRNAPKKVLDRTAQPVGNTGGFEPVPVGSSSCQAGLIPPRGVEPTAVRRSRLVLLTRFCPLSSRH